MTSDIPQALRAALGADYTIERELGGGMSRVFVATQSSLGRRVVVKVLRGELTGVAALERFRREILIAARLQHPHIVPLLSAGEADGAPWFTMPFVEGESLRERMRREGTLQAGDAVRVAIEVAGALAYAHREGIIHRDIKPENILLSRGHALVADFGIARATAASAGAPNGAPVGALTEAGMALGTLDYMSPEQLLGEREIDGSTDVYALACVLFEALTRELPFGGATTETRLAARLGGRPRSLVAARSDIPHGVDAAVRRALSAEPRERFASAEEFAAALRDVVAISPPRAR